ncbi:MAG: trigger factor [Coriobacteriia bacterium]
MSKKRSSKPSGQPKFTLSSYAPVEITLPVVEVIEADIDEQMKNMAEMYPRIVKLEREVQPGDEVYLEISSTMDGEPYRNMCGKRLLKLGDGFLPEEFDQQIIGMQAGETKTFDFDLPSGDDSGAKTVTSTITLLEIRQQDTAFEPTDEWVAQNFGGLKTVAELRANIKAQLEMQLIQHREQHKYRLVATALAQRLEGRIPDDIFDSALRANEQNFEEYLRRNDTNKEDYLKKQGIGEHQFTMQNLIQTREMVAQGLALDAMAEHLGLDVTDEEIDAVFGGRTAEQKAAARQEAEKAGRLDEYRQLALREKTLKRLVDNAKITYKV